MVAINFDAAGFEKQKEAEELKRSTPVWEWPEYAGTFSPDEITVLQNHYENHFKHTIPGFAAGYSPYIGREVETPVDFIEHWKKFIESTKYDFLTGEPKPQDAEEGKKKKKRGRPSVNSDPVVIAEKEARKAAYEEYWAACKERKEAKAFIAYVHKNFDTLFPAIQAPHDFVKDNPEN